MDHLWIAGVDARWGWHPTSIDKECIWRPISEIAWISWILTCKISLSLYIYIIYIYILLIYWNSCLGLLPMATFGERSKPPAFSVSLEAQHMPDCSGSWLGKTVSWVCCLGDRSCYIFRVVLDAKFISRAELVCWLDLGLQASLQLLLLEHKQESTPDSMHFTQNAKTHQLFPLYVYIYIHT